MKPLLFLLISKISLRIINLVQAYGLALLCQTSAAPRELKHILPNPEAKQYLFDPDRSFLDALTVARKNDLSKKWRHEVSEAITAMNSISAMEIPGFSKEDLAELKRITDIASKLIRHYELVAQSDS